MSDAAKIEGVLMEALSLARVAEALTSAMQISTTLLVAIEHVHEIDDRMAPELLAVLEGINTMHEALAAAVEVATAHFDLAVQQLADA